ncbi:MAG: MFS transporter [Chloroflexi bacterium]|nr:MFS transporter [Chloroflexota bacterium]
MQTDNNKKLPPVNAPQTSPAPRQKPFRALQNRDFRLLWMGQAISQLGTQMRIAGIGWQIYLLTHDPLQLGAIGLCRVIPLVAFSLIGGSTADVGDRRKVLLVAESILMFFSAALAVVTLTGAVNVWWIYAITILSSATNAFERPSFSALVPALVPRDQLSSAISLNTLNFQVATVIGPGLGGIIIALVGVQGVYWIDAASYVAVILSLVFIHYRPVNRPTTKVSLAAAIEGLQFVWGNKILISTMLLDFIATFFASSRTLLPIFATDVLHSGEIGFGLLSAADSVGAVITSLVMAWLNPSRFKHPGVVLLVAVFFFSLFTILFGFSTVLPLSLFCLFMTGACDTVSVVLRQTVSQLVTPDELRGRMQSVNMIFFAGGPQLGELEAGIVARLGGAGFSVVTGGIACALVVVAIATLSPTLRKYHFEKE